MDRRLKALLKRLAPSRMIDVADFGCDYCADDQNRWYGHVTQIASDELRGMILLQCPRCRTHYETTPTGPEEARRVTVSEAMEAFPEWSPPGDIPGR